MIYVRAFLRKMRREMQYSRMASSGAIRSQAPMALIVDSAACETRNIAAPLFLSAGAITRVGNNRSPNR
ncbi:MAG: hypothetical protein FD174_1671 [Geobacteraceae bacterium]|nr:MAG: hypothetical protein FD174_1671 [Geobacteraceae bacterium]